MLLALFSILMLASIGGGWATANNARNATGGPVPPAAARDYIFVALFFAIAVAGMLVGLWFMKK